jgi:hypothetical protein
VVEALETEMVLVVKMLNTTIALVTNRGERDIKVRLRNHFSFLLYTLLPLPLGY